MTERELQRRIVGALRAHGCIVCVTSNRQRTANTPGTPDLFVWRDGVWSALEVKAPTGKLTARQSVLAQCGATHVVRGVDEALAAVGISR